MQNFLDFHTNIFFRKYFEMCAFICKKHEGLVPQKNIFYSFCIFDLLSKKLENNFLWGHPFSVQIFLKYSFLNWIIKNICCCLFKNLFNWSPHFSTSFSKPTGIPTESYGKVYYYWDGFQLVPKYQSKVKLISNISVWNAQIAKKWKPRCVFINFQFP